MSGGARGHRGGRRRLAEDMPRVFSTRDEQSFREITNQVYPHLPVADPWRLYSRAELDALADAGGFISVLHTQDGPGRRQGRAERPVGPIPRTYAN